MILFKHLKIALCESFAVTILLLVLAINSYAQGPGASPTPEQRGLGVQSGPTKGDSQTQAQAREAKPELVLQTGYNNIFGATGLVFSPDGRLLATTTMRSSTIKLWETATGRELRNLSGGPQTGMALAPVVAFSRDSRLIAGAAGDNTVKIWDVVSGREIQTLASSQGTLTSAIAGVFFIAFTADGHVVTISDAVRLWDAASGQELRSIPLNAMNPGTLLSGGAGAVLTLDGSQLALVSTEEGKPQVKFWDLANAREARSVNLPDKDIQSLELSFALDGRLLAGGVVDKRLRMWDLSGKTNERDLGPTTTEMGLVRFTRDGKLIAYAEGFKVRLWDVATGRELPSLSAPNSGLFTAQGGRVFASFSEDGKK